MKKVLLFVFLLALAFPVKGLEDNVLYKYYKYNKVLGDYVLMGENASEFPLTDADDYIYSELSDLSINKPDDDLLVVEHDGFHYLKTPLVNAIEITLRNDSILASVSLESDLGVIEYTTENISEDVTRYNFNGEYDINDILIKIKSGGVLSRHSYTFSFKNNDTTIGEINSTILANRNYTVKGSFCLIWSTAYEDYYSLEKIDSDSLIFKGEVKLYQYQSILYRSFRLEKEYYPEYLSKPYGDYIYRDDNDYIILETGAESNEVLDDTNLEDSKEVKNETVFLGNGADLPNINSTYGNTDTVSATDNTDRISTTNNDAENPIKHSYKTILKTEPKTEIKQTSNTLYDYFKLFILIILLIITLKFKNKVKKFSEQLV